MNLKKVTAAVMSVSMLGSIGTSIFANAAIGNIGRINYYIG